MSFLFSDKKVINLEREMRLLNNLKYEDIVNVGKFLSKNNQFTVQCFGNKLNLSDLEIFSKDIKNQYSKKDLNHFFGGYEKVKEYQNEKFLRC